MTSWFRLPPDEAARRRAIFHRTGRIAGDSPPAARVYGDVPFNAPKYFGAGWGIWMGPPQGDGLSGEVERDSALSELTEVHGHGISVKHFMPDDQGPLDGEERLKIARSYAAARRFILLDAKAAEGLVMQPGQLILSWLYERAGIERLEMLGSVLRRPDGKRFCAVVERLESGLWRLTSDFVGGGKHAQNLVALSRP